MSTGVDEVATSSSNHAGMSSTSSKAQNARASSAADETVSSIQLPNGVISPGSPGSEADSTINSTTFAPSILASRLGRSLYSSAGAAGSSLSLSGSGFNSPSLSLTGFNAISTVLNNPSKRQHPIDPKSSRFPAVTSNHVPAEIPKVKKSELDSYLSSVRPEWDRFMRNQRMGRQGKATIEQQHQQQQQCMPTHDSSCDSEPLSKANRRHRSTASMASLSADLQAVPPPQARKRLPNLSAVPQVFFSEDFDLGNPYTFDQVTERYKVAPTSPVEQNGSDAPTYDVALNQMLQEKLSYYSDVIEQHLIIEIGQQSSSFFAALENLNDLNAEAESCLRKIDALKTELESIDDNQAKKGLRVIREQQHRRQLERKQDAVQSVREIIERRDLVLLLLQQGETEEALDLLNKLRLALRHPDSRHEQAQTDSTRIAKGLADQATAGPGVALCELQCLAGIPVQLEEMEQSLSGMLEQDLIAILKQDIIARLAAFRQLGTSSSTSANDIDYFTDAVTRSEKKENPNLAAIESLLTSSKVPASTFGHSAHALSPGESALASRIASLVSGLAKTGGVEKAAAAYREMALQTIQQTWRETLSRPSDDMAETVKWLLSEDLSKFDDHENLPPPAARIRDLDHASFLDMGRELFETLIECLKAIDAQCKLVPRILDELYASSQFDAGDTAAERSNDGDALEMSSPPSMPQGVPSNLPARLSEVVVASAEQAHSLCARLLVLRATTHAALELPPFLVIFQLCWSFVLSSEQLCRKMIVGLRGTVLSQAKGFLATFHRRRIERAAKAVEEETWAQAEVGAEIQAQIRQIVSSAVEDPADFVVTGGESRPNRGFIDHEDVGAGGSNSKENETPTPAKTLEIEDRQYFVVDASLDVLALLVDYLKVIINLPLLTTEAMARVVEFLKQFNSRTCQVVLGAGAMRSAGLKNITAKHLALASQSLSIMISLIPYIRETVRRHLSPKQAVMLTDFDKLRRDFQEHQYEIHAKLVAIMSDRLTVHCRTLSAIDWNAEKPSTEGLEGDESKDQEPNKYAADLVKETATLHKVLSKYLQAVVVEHVIGQVLRAIDARIAQEFEKVSVQNKYALDSMQTDVRYLGTKLSALKHIEWKDEALQQVLASKCVPSALSTVVSTSAGPSTPNNEAAPGSPAIDKPSATPFGPVTYKPRIPNIFARRQQQQQQSQSCSPRASTDVPGTSTPVEAQRSAETTPRTSVQLQQHPAQCTSASSQQAPNGEQQQAIVSAPEPPAKSEALGARSIEEEVDEIPPTPPSKTQEVEALAIVKTEDTDVRESEDLAAPDVPAPDGFTSILVETSRIYSDLPVETTDSARATAPTAAAEDAPESSERSASDIGHSNQSVSDTLPREVAASTTGTLASEPQVGEKLVGETNADTTKPGDHLASRGETAPAAAINTTTPATKSAQPSTPTKSTWNASAPAESSPARSGASTPATATPSRTPAKPGRMSLKERLAEAARKRAQQSAPSAARPTSQAEPRAAPIAAAQSAEPATPAASAAAPDTLAGDREAKDQIQAAAASDAPHKVDDAGAANSVVDAPVAADVSGSKPEEAAKAASTEKEAVGLDKEPQSFEQTASDQSSSEPFITMVDGNSQNEALQTDAQVSDSKSGEPRQTSSELPLTPTTSEEREADVQKESDGADRLDVQHRNDAGEDKTNRPAASITALEDKEAGAVTEVVEQPVKADDEIKEKLPAGNGTEACTKASTEASAITQADVDQDGDDEDAEADAAVNEGTNDSAFGSGTSTGSKKSKKKKKKGKKK